VDVATVRTPGYTVRSALPAAFQIGNSVTLWWCQIGSASSAVAGSILNVKRIPKRPIQC